MQTGEKELRQVFEETTTRNVRAVVEHANATRAQVRALREDLDHANNRIAALEDVIKQLRTQLVALQARVYAGGSR